MTLVKICGNRTPADVLAAAGAGADFVGMVFAESSRHVDTEEAQAMVRALGAPLSEREMMVPPPVRSFGAGVFCGKLTGGWVRRFRSVTP